MAKIETQSFTKKETKALEEQDVLIRDVINRFEQEKFPKYIDNYKQYLWYTLDRLADIESWQTNISYPLAASIVDTEFANLFDFNFVFWVQESIFKNLCWDVFDYKSQGKQALKWSLKECLITWEWFTETSLFKKKEEYTFLKWKYKQTVVTKKPSIDFISIFNVFYDDVQWINKSWYQIKRVFNTWDFIKDKYWVLFDDWKTKKVNIHWFINKVLAITNKTKTRYSLYDYNPIKRINNFSNIITKSYNNWVPLSTMIWSVRDELSTIDKNNFYLVQDKRSYEVVEYICKWKLTVYIDWNLLYHGEPILDWDVSSIRWISFNEIPGAWTSNWQIDNLSHLQNMQTSIWNWFLDNMKMQLSWMFTVKWNVAALSRDGKLRFEKFKAIKLTWDSDIKRLDLWLNDFSPINTIQFVEQITEKRAWVNGYLLWGQSKVERVSDSINLIHDQYKSKLTPVIDSVQIMMWWVAKAWILTYLKHFTEAELKELWLNITFKDKKLYVNELEVEKIIRDEAISFKFNSLRNIEKEKKRWIIKEIFMSLIQMKQDVNVDEIMNALLDDDFDLDKLKNFKMLNKWAKVWNEWPKKFWFTEEESDFKGNEWIDNTELLAEDIPAEIEDKVEDPLAALNALWI
jgi:hypothetical protein